MVHISAPARPASTPIVGAPAIVGVPAADGRPATRPGAARREMSSRAPRPSLEAPLHPADRAGVCLTCVDTALRIAARGRGRSTRMSGHRPAGVFPPGHGSTLPPRQAIVVAPRAPPPTG